MQRKWKNATRHKPKFTKIHWHLTNADRQLSLTCYSKIYATDFRRLISFHYAVNNGRFRCCDSVTLTIKSTLEPYYFLKHKTKPFNFHLPWFSGLCDYKRAKSDLLNGVDHSVLFSAERSEASNTLVPGTRGFGREGPKYSAVQQKTCDVSCCRHRVVSRSFTAGM